MTRVMVTAGLVVLLLGLVAIVGVWRTQASVERLVDRLEPAAEVNDEVLQSLTDAETGIRGWVLSGDEAFLEPWVRARDDLPQARAELREYADVDPRLPELIGELGAAVDAWLQGYALVRIERGPDGFDRELFATGKQRFDAIREAHAAIDQVLVTEQQRALADARSTYRWVVAGILLVLVVGGLIVGMLARALLQRVQRPLRDLETVVTRLAAGESDARFAEAGPREIQRVGRAVNLLAAERERGLAVEAEIQHQLLGLDQAKTDFVANVSHELRTPLTSIRGYLELLEESRPVEGDARRMWEAVDRNVDRLAQLIEDLLALSSAESGGTDLTELDLRGLVASAVADLRVTAATRGVQLEVRGHPETLPVLGDETQLTRAVLNIAWNAVKFSRPDGIVELRLSRDDDMAVLEICDDGIGIPAGDLASIGTRFFRAANAVQLEIGGTGLGVRIVQTILARHAGSLTYHSVEGEGTTATIRLPLRAEDS